MLGASSSQTGESLRQAGLGVGDEVAIEADGADRIVVRRMSGDAEEALGVFDGLYERGYLQRLRADDRVSGCVLDTDVVIAALDRRDPHHSSAATAIKRFADDGVPLLLSLLDYPETLVRPAEDEHTLQTARDALTTSGSSWSPRRPRSRWTQHGIGA